MKSTGVVRKVDELGRIEKIELERRALARNDKEVFRAAIDALKAESGKQGGSKGQANGKQSESKTEANCKQTAREKEKEKEKEVEYECTPPTPSSRSVFIPPTVDEVKEYCDSRGNGIDAQAFVDFYASKGWMIGKNKMKDWKASVRTWERDTRRVQQQRNKHEVSAHPETQNQRYGADWMTKYMKGGE